MKICHLKLNFKFLFIIFAGLIAVFMLLFDTVSAGNPDAPEAVDGVVDLSDWEFEEDGIISLSGDWEFYWEKLLEPADFLEKPQPEKTGFIYVPSDWNGYEVNGEELPGYGYATYRLTVKNLKKNEVMGIIKPELTTSYNLWVDDELLSVNGKVSSDPEEAEPGYSVDVVNFHADSTTAEIILQVANFHHRRGGHNTGIELGTFNQIHDERSSRTNNDLFLFGCFFILGIYNLGFFLYNRRDLSTLYFTLFCLSVIALTATFSSGEMLIHSIFPNIDWTLQVRIEYLSMPLAGAMLMLFFRELYPEDTSYKFTKGALVFVTLYAVFIFVTPVSIFSHASIIMQLIGGVLVLYIVRSLILIGFIKRREGAALLITGFMAVIIAGLYEALIYSYIIESRSILNYGLIVFVLTQSMLISTRFIRAYLNVESMSQKLKEHGESLEDKVRKRTEKLGDTLEKLSYAIVNETNVAISNLSGGSQELANIASKASERSIEMKEKLEEADSCQYVVNECIDKGVETISGLEKEMVAARQSAEKMGNVSTDLTEALQGIQEYNYEIKSLAKRVNLLAVNTSIEAARAGEEGENFAVVAEEVKKLSGQTYSFFEDIEKQAEISNKKLAELQESVDGFNWGVSRTEEAVETTNKVYYEIINSVKELTGKLNKVLEQIDEVAGDSESISQISEEQAATNQEIDAQISNLVELVESLEEE